MVCVRARVHVAAMAYELQCIFVPHNRLNLRHHYLRLGSLSPHRHRRLGVYYLHALRGSRCCPRHSRPLRHHPTFGRTFLSMLRWSASCAPIGSRDRFRSTNSKLAGPPPPPRPTFRRLPSLFSSCFTPQCPRRVWLEYLDLLRKVQNVAPESPSYSSQGSQNASTKLIRYKFVPIVRWRNCGRKNGNCRPGCAEQYSTVQ